MNTQQIYERIEALQQEIENLYQSFPYMAKIYVGNFEQSLPGADKCVCVDYSNDCSYPNIKIASDNLEALLRFCEACQDQFTVYTKGTLTHKQKFDEETRRYVVVPV